MTTTTAAVAPLRRRERRSPAHPPPANHRCPTCRLTLPFTADYFPRNASQAFGLHCQCLSCHREAQRRRAARKRTKVRITAVPDSFNPNILPST